MDVFNMKVHGTFDYSEDEDEDLNEYNEEKHNDDATNPHKKRKLNEQNSKLCPWTGRYSDLEKHIKKCSWRSVQCSCCYQMILQNNLEKHHDECPLFPMQCDKCGESGIDRKDMADHITKYCPKRVIECNLCQQRMYKNEKEYHDENICPEAVIDCGFHCCGCKEKMKRRDHMKHLQDPIFSQDHLMQMVKSFEILQSRMDALEKSSS